MTFEGQLPEGHGRTSSTFDRVLVSVGRRPNSAVPGLDKTRVKVDQKGFIEVDASRATAEPTIYAIGDVVGEPMLAHKASHEARVAIDSILGERVAFEPEAIPAVVFTDPEVAWCGLTENEAAKQKREVTVTRFPWGASGRAITLDRTDGMTKLVIDPKSERVLGVGIVGPGAGELIAEAVLAVEMGATAADLKLTIHAHPTLSETLMEAAEVFFGGVDARLQAEEEIGSGLSCSGSGSSSSSTRRFCSSPSREPLSRSDSCRLALANTSSIIGGVSLPVFVFCRLG